MTNKKYYYNPETETCLIKSGWLVWFNENGNNDTDGWADAETWFSDMLRNNLFVELENVIAVFTINEKLVIVERFNIDDYSIYFDDASLRGEWNDIAEYFADNFNGASLNDYINKTSLK